jgi:transcriptional regulator with XRE-family HTH domain
MSASADPENRDLGYEYRRRLGLIVKEARLKKGLTQQDMADHLKVHFTAISRIERGLNGIPPEWYEDIAELLGLNKEQFAREILRWSNPWLYALMYGKRELSLKEDLAQILDRTATRRE